MKCHSRHGTFNYNSLEERPTEEVMELVDAWFLMTGFAPPYICTVKSVSEVEGMTHCIGDVSFDLSFEVRTTQNQCFTLELMPSPESSEISPEASPITQFARSLTQSMQLNNAASLFWGDIQNDPESEMYWRITGILHLLKKEAFGEDEISESIATAYFPSREALLACCRYLARRRIFFFVLPSWTASNEGTRYELMKSFKDSLKQETEARRDEVMSHKELGAREFIGILKEHERELFKRLPNLNQEVVQTENEKGPKERRIASQACNLHPMDADWFFMKLSAVGVIEPSTIPADDDSVLGRMWRLNDERYREVALELQLVEEAVAKAWEAAEKTRLASLPTEDERLAARIEVHKRNIAQVPDELKTVDQRLESCKAREAELWELLRQNDEEQRRANSARDELNLSLKSSQEELPRLEEQLIQRKELVAQEARKLLEAVSASAQGLKVRPETLFEALALEQANQSKKN